METFLSIAGRIISFAPIVIIFVVIFAAKKSQKNGTLSKILLDLSKMSSTNPEQGSKNTEPAIFTLSTNTDPNNIMFNAINIEPTIPTSLNRKTRYLHIALNNTMEEAYDILSKIPRSNRILIEVGTPLIKIYGTDAIRQIRAFLPSGTYIVADNKCADLAEREVQMMAEAGANAATCLGVAPIETIDEFINQCEKFGIDSMIDMMNVDNALSILKKLKKLPKVVILHRGVDESEFSKEKQIPYYQIKQIKGNYNIMVAVAGGDTIKEIQRAIFNDADIVVVWKNFYAADADTAVLADSFLKEI